MSEVLIDTHTLIWWFEGRDKLSGKARKIIEDREIVVLVSAASAWELAIKCQMGKFRSRELVDSLDREIEEEGFVELPVTIEHAVRAGSLRGPHKDPFDRMLIAQALARIVPVVSADKCFDTYGVRRLW